MTRNYEWHFLLSTLLGLFLITGESPSDLQYGVSDLASSAASFMREDLDHNLCFHFFCRGLGGDYMRQAGMKCHCSHFCVPVIFIRDLKIITGV